MDVLHFFLGLLVVFLMFSFVVVSSDMENTTKYFVEVCMDNNITIAKSYDNVITDIKVERYKNKIESERK